MTASADCTVKRFLVFVLSRLPVFLWPTAGALVRACWRGFGRA